MKAEECEEKVKHEGTSDSEKNKNEGNPDLDKSKLKAIARKNFDNILRSHIESRSSTIINTEVNNVEKSSQLIRIENSKITKVQAIKSHSPTNLHASLPTNNNEEEMVVVPANLSKENTFFTDKTLQSIAAINLAFKPKDVDCQVFVYEPMYVNSSTLGSINPEKHYKSDKPLPAKGANNSPADCLLNESTTLFKCYICPYYHVKEMMVARHMIQIHLSQNIYRCHYCPAQFLTNHLAYVHIQKMHENAEIKIDFKISDQISTQLGLAYKKKFYILDGKAVSQNEVENIATSQKSGSSVSVKCHKCGLYCKSVEELQEHSKLVHFRYRPYSCSLCNYSKVCFASKLDLDHHMKATHPNELWVRSSVSPSLPNNSSKKAECDVSINWSLVWGENIQTGNIMCEWCSYGTDSCRDMFVHASKEHNWSKSISCPTCKKNHALKPCHFVTCEIVCSCNTTLNIQHEKNKSRVSWMENSYVCKLCSRRAYSKSGIMRHLKYNHTHCKPFNCIYCPYAAKEASKVKTHILAIHVDKPVKIIDKEQCNEEFKKILDDLFETHVQIEKQSFENATAAGNSSFSINLAKNANGDSVFECGLCAYVSRNVYEVYSHARLVHEQIVKPERRNAVMPQGEHYRCVSCGYRCSDRSCMSRHAKYMHITSRPHSCPYCTYNNVEKTKVRLHVLSHHKDMPKVVKTNQLLLEEMSIEAKKFYVRVDEKGDEYKECKNGGMIYVAKRSTFDLKKVDAIDRQDQNSFNEVVALKEEPMEVENVKEAHLIEFDDFKHPFDEALFDASAVMMNVEEGDNVKHDDNLSQKSSAMVEDEDYSNMNKLSDEVLENFSENEDVEMVTDDIDNSLDVSSESDVNVDEDGDNDEEDSYFSSDEWDAVNKSLKRDEIVDLSKFLIEKETLEDEKISKMVPILKLKDVIREYDNLNDILSKIV